MYTEKKKDNYCPLTHRDGINFSLDLNSAVVTFEDVNRLLHFCFADHNIFVTVLIFLQPKHTVACNNSLSLQKTSK